MDCVNAVKLSAVPAVVEYVLDVVAEDTVEPDADPVRFD
jgi:hypothetical protein